LDRWPAGTNGEAGIPGDWRAVVARRDEIIALADRLLNIRR
jgi:hypothetical protein